MNGDTVVLVRDIAMFIIALLDFVVKLIELSGK